VVGWRATRRCQILRHWVAALLLAAWITGIGGCLGRGGRWAWRQRRPADAGWRRANDG